ncbi:sensor domain-containing diguanylate cyclase [Lamprobacter modestohalophilus]|nr:sensor domain-containing diguanylate cyclase [Lamprobacter modestohalophilus]MEA1051287.1 sensor domain-containing diguanylate cyclase [Lamprobacter modestohalophilus]
MQITEAQMQVLLRSGNHQNPYEDAEADQLGQGLYCETVIGEDRPLLVENALADPHWRDNPDLKRNMVSYFGLPIHWPDGTCFGTICVLDIQAHTYQSVYQEILSTFRDTLEEDLLLLEKKRMLELMARTDDLTGLRNRRELSRLLEYEQRRAQRTATSVCLILLDLNGFKQVNDRCGHEAGDEVLRRFAHCLKESVRTTDVCGRWGGDEFLVICPDTDLDGAKDLLARLRTGLAEAPQLKHYPIGVAAGIATLSPGETTSQWVIRADQAMYQEKRARRL